MKRFTLLFCVLFTLASSTLIAAQKPPRIAKLLADTKANIAEIDAAGLQELKAKKPEIVIVDVREQSEWDMGYLKEAALVNRGILEFRIERMAPSTDTPIVLYCAGGNRSALAAERLQQMGYTEVYSLMGGFASLVENGKFEIETPQ